jgi:hypothetical protein
MGTHAHQKTLLASCRFWYFGVDQCLRRLLADPVTGPHILSKTARTPDDPSTFHGSEAFRLLDADCAGALTRRDIHTVLLSIGGDGVQLLNWGCRTATVIGMKCEDLPPELVQKGVAIKPLMVIEGPQEPSVLNHALQGAASFFVEHAPSTNGKGVNHSLPASFMTGAETCIAFYNALKNTACTYIAMSPNHCCLANIGTASLLCRCEWKAIHNQGP